MNSISLLRPLQAFIKHEASGGIVLMATAVIALIFANSAAAPHYFGLLEAKIGGLSVLHWINDALMAVFFLLVGLEIKRELIAGQLADWPSRILPGIAALGGMIVPALCFVLLNRDNAINLRGWAIPTATDIAFALGVLALLGSRVPPSLKVFLTALAILDDLGAVLVIAIFYTADLKMVWIGSAALVLVALAAANRFGVRNLGIYLILGAVLWFLVLRSGVHATVAGVLLAFTIPLGSDHHESPLHSLEHALSPWVAFAIVPIFGFANAGVSLAGFSWEMLFAPLTLGIALGLFVGKQIGVFATTYAVIKLNLAKLPARANWLQLYGVASLCGIGFTMSLFIGLLAYADMPALQKEMKTGVLFGSILSAVLGSAMFILAGKRGETTE